MTIKFGPAGLGPVKDAINNLEEFSKLGLKACEIAFTYGIYIKKEEDIREIRKASDKFGVKLSIHAPYWINLNGKGEKKTEESKNRILRCCEIGDRLGAEVIVFHAGYYRGMDEDKSYENIKKAILEMMVEIKKRKLKVKLAPETMGKINVFGSVEQISRLVNETGCGFCLDFAHVLARDKKVDYEKIKKLFPSKDWHCHFSGIEYGEKGEKRHKKTSYESWKKLLKELPKNKDIVIINESPEPVEDSVEGLRVFRS